MVTVEVFGKQGRQRNKKPPGRNRSRKPEKIKSAAGPTPIHPSLLGID
ncbi:MAG: hypothetical protein M9959_07310 [Chitinophagaceae bacterium]|nr:hypothetical protein [Chitinophagaceae bacterium]HRN49454.1 hypothetical protein [Niabella sp.]